MAAGFSNVVNYKKIYKYTNINCFIENGQYRLTFDSRNFEYKKAVGTVGIPHNLEPRDSDIINYIKQDIILSKPSHIYSYAVQSNNTVKIIGYSLPSYYSGLSSVNLSLAAGVNGYAVSIIGSGALENFAKLKSIHLPKSLVTIESNALRGCSNLTSVTFEEGSNLKKIDGYAFKNCSKLANISLSNSLNFIGDRAFENCAISPSNGVFKLPDNLNTYGTGVFMGCKNISAYSISASNAYFMVSNGVLYNKAGMTLLDYPEGKTVSSFTVPSAVTTIAESAVCNNQFLNTIYLSNVKTIRKNAFQNCINLGQVTGAYVEYIEDNAFLDTSWLNNNTSEYMHLGFVLIKYQGTASKVMLSGYKSISAYAFANNSHIVEVVIGDGITNIGSYAFYNCGNLKIIKILAPYSVVQIGDYAFDNNANLRKIYVPQLLLPDYNTDEIWIQYSSDLLILSTDISFNSLGGSYISNATANYGADQNFQTPVKAGYNFTGWYFGVANGTATGGKYELYHPWLIYDNQIVLYAGWEKQTYSVLLDHQNGTSGTNISVAYSSPMPGAPVPTREGYTFGGYYTGPNGTGTQYYTASMGSAKNYDLTNAIILYAKWTPNTYTVTFDKQNGTGGTSSVSATFGSAMPSAIVPTRTGYVFVGYFSEPNGAGSIYYNSNMVAASPWDKASDKTIYAFWQLKEFEIVIRSSTQWIEINSNTLGLQNYSITVEYGANVASSINNALINAYLAANGSIPGYGHKILQLHSARMEAPHARALPSNPVLQLSCRLPRAVDIKEYGQEAVRSDHLILLQVILHLRLRG